MKMCPTGQKRAWSVFWNFYGHWVINPLNSFSNWLPNSAYAYLWFWGLGSDSRQRIIERIHLFAIKRLLNVGPRTPSSLVYGETGRYPLYISTCTRCIKYWLNILRMQEDRIPLKSYKLLHNMHCNNKNNWASSVCFTLYRYGYGHV